MLKVPCLGPAAAHCPGLLGRALRPLAVTDSVRAGAQWEAVSAGRSRRCCGLAHPQAHVVVASAADDDEAVVAGDVAAVEVTRLTKRCPPPPPHTLPYPATPPPCQLAPVRLSHSSPQTVLSPSAVAPRARRVRVRARGCTARVPHHAATHPLADESRHAVGRGGGGGLRRGCVRGGVTARVVGAVGGWVPMRS